MSIEPVGDAITDLDGDGGVEEVGGRGEELQPSDGLCGGYPLHGAGADDQICGDSAGYRRRYAQGFDFQSSLITLGRVYASITLRSLNRRLRRADSGEARHDLLDPLRRQAEGQSPEDSLRYAMI